VIRRVTLYRLVDRGSRDAFVREARALADAGGVRALHVGVPADAGAEVWDVLVELELADLAAADGLQGDPVHRAFAARTAALVEIHKAWNFATG
jgi:hypothetical protein